LLRLYREDNEEVAFLDPIPDDRDRVHVRTKPRGVETSVAPLGRYEGAGGTVGRELFEPARVDYSIDYPRRTREQS
jgi:hypothetical protein